jgi:hypothetical protein
MSTTFQSNSRIIHRSHPEYGYGLVRYVEEDAFGDPRLQVAFDHLDQLVNVAPADVDQVQDPLTDAAAASWGELEVFKRKLAAGLVIGENNLTGGVHQGGCPTSASSSLLARQGPGSGSIWTCSRG